MYKNNKMKFLRFISIIILSSLLIGCYSVESSSFEPTPVLQKATPTKTVQSSVTEELSNHVNTKPVRNLPEIQPTPTPIPQPDLYGCNMSIEFTSGPLSKQISEFDVLDETYFEDKGDKFAVGKGTAVFYEAQPYLILHSSYVDGNIFKPMEAEFIRKYLEHWGNNDNEYIQGQIDNLLGAKVDWFCDGELLLSTSINSIVRLSHEASNRLWLEPTEIPQILEAKEGLSSEWIGEIQPSEDPSLYLGFCGWGSPSIESGRYTYYRYLLQFTYNYP